MCTCGLLEDVHWFVDKVNAPMMFMVGRSPEQAEASLRSWAAKVLRIGNFQMDMRPIAAKILATRVLNMVPCCTGKLIHPHIMDF